MTTIFPACFKWNQLGKSCPPDVVFDKMAWWTKEAVDWPHVKGKWNNN